MYVTVMPVSAYMALAFVFGFIQINWWWWWSEKGYRRKSERSCLTHTAVGLQAVRRCISYNSNPCAGGRRWRRVPCNVSDECGNGWETNCTTKSTTLSADNVGSCVTGLRHVLHMDVGVSL